MSHHFVQFSSVHYKYPSGYHALKGISFRINHGEKVAFIGSNGAGKSTMILHMNGLLLPTEGSVNIGDIPLSKKTSSIIRKKVGLVFQNADDQLFMPTVEEDVAFGPTNMQLPLEEIERRVSLALSAVGALSYRKSAPYHLSGGQKRSAAIASVLAMEPEILVLDEPSSNLDPKARRLLIDQIKGFNHTCIIATHDLEMAWELCNRIIVMHQGKIIADDTTKNIFENAELLKECGLEQPYQLIISNLQQNINHIEAEKENLKTEILKLENSISRKIQ
ncbi:MAG: energy-coupling factor ABC transporter ATP-binding protein [Marinifilaceae bacterium]